MKRIGLREEEIGTSKVCRAMVHEMNLAARPELCKASSMNRAEYNYKSGLRYLLGNESMAFSRVVCSGQLSKSTFLYVLIVVCAGES